MHRRSYINRLCLPMVVTNSSITLIRSVIRYNFSTTDVYVFRLVQEQKTAKYIGNYYYYLSFNRQSLGILRIFVSFHSMSLNRHMSA